MESNDICRLAVEGELTITTAAVMKEHLLAALEEGADIEIDLSQLTDIDSFGIQLMVAAKREALVRRKTFRFIGHRRSVLALLELCDLIGYSDNPVLISRAG